MAKRQVVDVKGFEEGWGYAGVVRVGDLVFVSGLIAMSDDGTLIGVGDMAAQIRHVYTDLSRALATVGCTLGDVVKETIHTTNIEQFVANKHVRAEFFSGAIRPASSAWHEVTRLVHPSFLVEVEAIAIADSRESQAR